MKKTVLDNGLTILTDSIEWTKTATVSYFIKAGSYDEKNYPNGIAHYIEHMLFKGTTNRNAQEINEAIDIVGGDFNAYTDYEKTKYYCVVPYDKWDVGLDVMSDIVWNHTIPEEEFNKERTVIFEEIKMYSDDAYSVAIEALHKKMHDKYSNRQSIIGTKETVGSITREDMINFIDDFYQPNNMVLVVTGNIQHDDIVNFMKNYKFTRNGKTTKNVETFEQPDLDSSTVTTNREIEQAHLSWGLFAPSITDNDSHIIDVVINLLAGTMSSRLYRIIREERGLAYSISAYYLGLNDSGVIHGHVGLEPSKVEEVQNVIIEEFERLVKEEVSKEELNKSISSVTGRFMRGIEKPSSVNEYQGTAYLSGYSVDPDEYIEKVKSVSSTDIMNVAKKYFTPDNWQFANVLPR